MDKKTKAIYDEMSEELKFNPHSLDAAILQQSFLYQKVQEYYANSNSDRDLAKKHLEEEYAKVSLRIREQSSLEGKKLTEDLVKQLTLLDPDYQESTSVWLDAKLDSELWGALKESYSSRGFMIKTMAQLWIASYFSNTTVRDTENSMDEVQHQQVRKAMSLKRKELQT